MNEESNSAIRENEARTSIPDREHSPDSEHFYEATSEGVIIEEGAVDEIIENSLESKEGISIDGAYPRKKPTPVFTHTRQQRKSFFSNEFRSERLYMLRYIVLTLLLICAVVLALLSVYWGSYFERESKTGNLVAYVYNYDQPQQAEGLDSGIVGQTLVNSLPKNSLGWEFRNESLSIDQIREQVHQENAWVAVVVSPNATDSLYRAFQTADSSFNKTGLVQVIFERERDLTTVNVILPQLIKLDITFQEMGAKTIYGPILQALSNKQTQRIVSDASELLTAPIQIELTDLSSYSPTILIAPLQVGLIYLIIIAFFQFNFFAAMNQRIGPQLTPLSNTICRIVVGYISYFVIALFVSFVSLAFQIKFRKAGDFVAYFLISFLAMAALGFVLETVALFVIPIYPPGLGFILLLWVIWNISPAFSAIELCPGFYKYGYAFPVYNALSGMRCFVAGTTRKNIGRNVGILIAWNVVAVLCFPFALRFFARSMNKKAIAEKRGK